MTKYFDHSRGVRWGLLSLLVIALMLGVTLPYFMSVQAADVTNGLDVKIIAAPNFVVDSNVQAPSTYAPRVATVIGEFCNTGSATLTNVTGYIGEYSSTTPGTYPVRSADMAEHPHLNGSGDYSFTHLGSTSDASRYVGDLAPGQCSYQYWHFTYPACENVAGSPEEPPCTNDPVWGATNDYDDDLWLTFDVWGTSTGSGTTSDNETHTARMRNEISAMANKIEPNGNPGGQWFNTDTSTVNPGETITTNGILYRLGNVNQGFDNNNDGVPDYNAWLQPFGDPSYDPSCFRLIETTGVLTVTITSGDVIIPINNNLYFSDLPPNNTNVIGEIYYEFLALGGACSIPISPYQEAASGYDNEKFNGDYGAGPAPLQTIEPSVTIDKSGSPAAGAVGSRVDYTIGFENTSTEADAGLVLSSGAGGTISLVISDTIPTGMTYIAGSAAASNSIPSGNSVSIRYYDTSTSSWTTTEPATAANVSIIQWWLDDPLERAGTGNNSGSVTFAASLPGTAPTPPFIENCAAGSFVDADPFAESCTVTMIQGTNSIGTYVWQDANSDGGQDEGTAAGITNVLVSLYWDKNGDGLFDSGDVLITTQDTSGVNDANYTFSNLPNGDFLVVVDDTDTDLPAGYGPTTATTFAVTGLGTTITSPYIDADFGFGPILAMTKSLSSSDPAYESENVTWIIDLENTRPGDGTGQESACTYTVWASSEDVNNTGSSPKIWNNIPNAFNANELNEQYAYADYNTGSSNLIAGTGFNNGPQAGNITQVEAVFQIYLDVLLLNDYAIAELFLPASTSNSLGTHNFTTIDLNAHVGTANVGTISWDVTGLRTWDWADFPGDLGLSLEAQKSSNADPSIIYLDAIGFRVTTDQTCGGADDTITLLPLSDEYDDALFDFVSASPAPDSATTGVGTNYNPAGLLSWTNLGPLYAGQTKQVTVVLKALQPPDTDADGEPDPATTINYASVTGATFANGNPVNDANDDDDVTINPAGTIGDLIWNDMVGDGVYDPDGADNIAGNADDEIGISGVTVELQDGTCIPSTDCLTTATDASGAYLFEGVQDGTTYVVVVDTTTLPNGGAGATNTHDRDADNDSDSGALTINNNDGSSANDDVLDADFGYTIPTLLEGSIWHDRDQSADSAPDDGEEGLTNVWVYVNDGSCTYTSPGGGTCLSAQTDANGDFTITGLTPAGGGTTYNVTVDTGTGDMSTGTWTQSYDTPNGPDGIPGTADDVTALDHIVPVALYPGGLGNADYSYYATGTTSIAGTVYADWNGDATQDTGDDGFENVTVYLYEDDDGDGIIDPEDALIDSTTLTDSSGNYTFSNLPADTYIVVVDENDPDLPSDYQQTEDPDVGSGTPCAGTACDGLAGADTTSGNVADHDFGYQPVGYGSIGDYVWQDDNANGLQDSSESGIANITVNLYVWEDDGDGIFESGEQGAFIATTTSATDGSYLFDNLPAGDYIVDVDESDTDVPANHVVSSTYDHDDDLTTADINNDPMGVSLAAGENFLDADFGFAPGGTIGDYVWLDNNGNGEQDASESGINGVTVTLYNDVNGNGVYDSGTDTLYGSTTTVTNGGQDGYYAFTDLPAGDYVVVATAPANHTLTGDPDAYAADGTPYPPYDASVTYTGLDGEYGTSLLGGASDLTADFGYLPDGTIGDTLWLDFDADGVLDVGEPGVTDVYVYLDDGSCTYTSPGAGTCSSVQTDTNGNYIFNSVSNGTYTVTVDTATLPSYLSLNYDPDETNPCTTCDDAGSVTISGGSTDLTIDFGYIGTNSISGTVWHDDNDDTVIDSTEPIRYENVPIYLWDCGADACGGSNDDDVYLGTTLTDGSGNYIFDNLPNGDYRVVVNPSVPALDGLDPTIVASSTTYHDVTLSGSTNSTGNDFGFLSAVDYGDLPAAYERTISGDNGARHTISSNLYLGSAQPDADPDGQESADAGRQNIADNGDDYDADGNDDDGVTRQAGLGGVINGGGWTDGAVASNQGGSLNIEIGGTWSGVPQVFIDFDGDDITYTLTEVTLLDSSGNPLTMPLAPSATPYRVYFDVPMGTFPGGAQNNTIFIRVRLSSTGGLGATGLASNGEVEDYQSDFGPNAITLVDFSAQALDMRWVVALAGLTLLGVGVFFLLGRKQKAANRIHHES